MRRLSDFLSEDTNQFGPGTDLVISLLAILLVMFLINGHLYQQEKAKNEARGRSENFRVASDGSGKKYKKCCGA